MTPAANTSDASGPEGGSGADRDQDRLTAQSHALWWQICTCLAVLASAPHGIGGICFKGRYGPAHTRILDIWRALGGAQPQTLPANIDYGALVGGVDIAQSLQAGRKVMDQGRLYRNGVTDGSVPAATGVGSVICIHRGEGLSVAAAMELARWLDSGHKTASRSLLIFDESDDGEAGVPAALMDRIAFTVHTDGLRPQDCLRPRFGADSIRAAIRDQAVLPDAALADGPALTRLADIADAFGVRGVRSLYAALLTTRAIAALSARDSISGDDIREAASLVLLPRATQIPAQEDGADPTMSDPDKSERDMSPTTEGEAPQTESSSSNFTDSHDRNTQPPSDGLERSQPLETMPAGDQMVAELRCQLPPEILADIAQRSQEKAGAQADRGRSGARAAHSNSGRPGRVMRPQRRGDRRIDIPATLMAALPHQSIRRRLRGDTATKQQRVSILPEDIRIRPKIAPERRLIIFVVDASGSHAMGRMAQAKGAVLSLLSDCYVKRDDVALIAFRTHGADVVLPPTRALARASAALKSMTGGGGTPFAAGLNAGLRLALEARRAGTAASLVILSDGKANIGLDARPGRAAARLDAETVARQLRRMAIGSVFVDTSPFAGQAMQDYADISGGRYVRLPAAMGAGLLATVARIGGQTPDTASTTSAISNASNASTGHAR